ncbi:hypothetical protein Athai_47930 [Actinocatenispora thailandica]|uniref:DUF2871 domain-containing protein n=1 Tax=Actinocatenispora thailandica TaxID=227318 RepID=A0A7R7DSZ9_9ACTN|nr:DUF2871 domain-containing protein [Actinocatenispora thailandica]BCJ37290.1 hypothetical protein Athai_47930 [Actinocatenispora thailandica]
MSAKRVSMRASYYAAHTYMILGVSSGLFYREFTKANHFTGDTQLAVTHTHLLALGMLGFLIVLALDKQFQLSGTRLHTTFFWLYNAGIAVSVTMMGVHGCLTVLGQSVPEVVPIVAGIGHTVLTVGLVLLFVQIGKRLKDPVQQPPAVELSERATV